MNALDLYSVRRQTKTYVDLSRSKVPVEARFVLHLNYLPYVTVCINVRLGNSQARFSILGLQHLVRWDGVEYTLTSRCTAGVLIFAQNSNINSI